MRFASSSSVYEYLNSFMNLERALDPKSFRLDRMEALRELFGRPDESYRITHVAGSKGKGSTATMLAAVMDEDSGPTGLYTSPHLLDYTERIAIAGRPVVDAVLLPAAEALAAGLEAAGDSYVPGGEPPTFFELLTMLGFLCFKAAGCDRAVVEVGLGGRLDSTNVVSPEACVITPIELEHTEILGDTIAKIAAEKAGILKPGVPVFTSAVRPEALEVIRARAEALGCPFYALDEEAAIRDVSIGAEGTRAVVSYRDASLFGHDLELRSPMAGSVQARNAALAALAARKLGMGEEAIRAGIAKARLRARFEILPGDPVVVLDGAHTPDSVAAAAADFKTIFPAGGVLLFGCAKDKAPAAMAASLRESFGEVIVTRPGTFKQSDTESIAAAFASSGYAVTRIDDTEEAFRTALALARGKGLPLLVTGSFYLCGIAAGLSGR